MTQETTIRWLKLGSALTIFFGALIAAAAVPAMSGPVQFLADLIFFPLDGLQSVAAEETRLINAIGGGVMVGWGVMLWMVSTQLYPKEPVLAGKIIMTSIIVWFVIDSAGSVFAGAPLNALGNVSFLLIFCLPLWWSRKGG
jgi:hypothetical protein